MKRFFSSLGLLSASLIAYQIVLMYLFSITQWYHFAYMVIAIAMLGFGTSGTIIALARKFFLDRSEILFPLLMFLSGITMIVAIPVSQTSLFRFESQLILFEWNQIVPLLLTYLIFFLPFLFGALAIGLAFTKYVERIGSLYFANLFGSGLGGGIIVLLLWILFPQQLPVLVALFPITAGFLILPQTKKKFLISIGAVGFLCVLVIAARLPRFVMSEYKGMSKTLNLPDAKIVLSKTSPDGLVQIVQSPALRFAPGLSLNYRMNIPQHQVVFNNGDRYASLMSWSRTDTTHILNYTISALPFVFSPIERVLILNAGTGVEAAHAITQGATSIIAVEPHRIVADLLKHEYVEMTDSLFYDTRVSFLSLDPRTFLMRDTSHFDLIIFPMIESFGGSMGLQAVQERYALTKEAVREMWNRLTPDGMISFSSWVDYPIRSPLKVLATLAEVLEESGINNLQQHIVAVRSWGTIIFVAKRSPVTEPEIEQIRRFSEKMFFDPALLPGIDPEERTRYNAIHETDFFKMLDYILSEHRPLMYERYEFDIRPATDDRPYFSQFLRWKTLQHLRDLYGDRSFPFLEIGYLIVAVTFIQVSVLALILIILPLFKLGWRSRGKSWTLLYFGMLGFGYMFVEIVFINRFTLYLGHPIYAASAVISIMLLSSGIGSYISSRFPLNQRTIRKITILILIILALYAFILMPLLMATIAFPFGIKIALSLLLIALPAFFMGIPFPLGLRFLAHEREENIPWAWGINGCFSVMATPLALIVAVEAGFIDIMIISAGFYGIAALSSLIRVS